MDDRWERSQSDPDRVRTPTSYLTICRTETDHSAAHIARFDPARVLAECEAKRRVVTAIARWLDAHPDEDHVPAGDDALCWLALPYADHPDYREEWRS